jgi:flagellar hook-associated protein 2
VNYVTGSTALSQLNDGLGVRYSPTAADFTITVGAGAFDVDITDSTTTLQGVVDAINTAAGNPGVTASIENNRLKLVSTSDNIQVTALNNSNAALDLGLIRLDAGGAITQIAAENSVGAGAGQEGGNQRILSGDRLVATMNDIMRDTLGGGVSRWWTDGSDALDSAGVRSGAGYRISVTSRNGTSSGDIYLASRVATNLTGAVAQGATSIDVNSANGFAAGNTIRLTDGTNTEYKVVTRISSNTLYFDNQAVAAAAGFANNSGVYAYNQTLGEMVQNINYKASAAGMSLTSGGSGNLQVADVAGTVAADLGIAVNAAQNDFNGADLDPQYVAEQTLLSTLKGGTGITAGRFSVTDTAGRNFIVDLRQSDDDSVRDVITEFNGAAAGAGSDLVMRVNDTGDGLYVYGTGNGTVTVTDLDGTDTANDLNLAGSATGSPATINGSFERSISVSATDTLTDVMNKISEAGLSVSASIINDGSGGMPYRLSILSKNSGINGRMVVGSTGNLSFTTAAAAQDAVLLYGVSSSGSDPAIIQSSTNTVSNVIAGLTLDLRSVSSSPVTITVNRDAGGITKEVGRLVERLNDTLLKVGEYTKFAKVKEDQYSKGVLFGDTTVNRIKSDILNFVTRPVSDIPASQLNTLAEVGVRVDRNGYVTFNESTFRSALENNFEQVSELFTKSKPMALDSKLKTFNDSRGVGYAQGDDLTITQRDGTTVTIDISSSQTTLSEIMSLINYDSENTGDKVTASISSDGKSLVLSDASVGAGTLAVTALNGSSAAADLGLTGSSVTVSGGTLTGRQVSISGGPGAAVRLYDKMKAYTDTPDGLIASKTESIDTEIEDYNDRIAALEKKIAATEEKYVRQFAQLESYLSESEQIKSRLSAVLGSMTSGYSA